jgi:hypothetical protein
MIGVRTPTLLLKFIITLSFYQSIKKIESNLKKLIVNNIKTIYLVVFGIGYLFSFSNFNLIHFSYTFFYQNNWCKW